ncbi:MAG: hypothetical protein AB7L84_14145 [Acidimicrobiia bacterium]
MVLTVDLPADVLRRLEAEAARRGVTVDTLAAELMAELADRLPAEAGPADAELDDAEGFFGFVPFPKRGSRVTNEIIDRLRDELLA